MVKYCPRCGSPNPDDAVFCQRCGYPLQGTQQIQPPQPIQQPLTPPQPIQYAQQPAPYSYPYYQQPKTASDYGQMLARWGTILYGIVYFLLGIGGILSEVSFYTSGEPGKIVGSIILSAIGSAMLFLLGVIALLIGFTKNIMRWMFLGGIFIFIYFLMMGIGYIYTGVEFGQSASTAGGVLLIISSIFVFLAAFFAKNINLGRKLFAIVLGIVSFFIIYGVASYYAGLVGLLQGLASLFGQSSSPIPAILFLFSASFFNSDLALLAIAFMMTMLSVVIILFYSNLTKYINVFLYLAFLIFSLGVLVLGVEGVSGGIPSMSGMSAAFKASVYVSVTAAIIDIAAGSLLTIGALIFLANYFNNLQKKNQ
ncbi:hypothetical protein SJAV_27710 [Sulfurisphaera javensis]|uniref:Zinc-ribbon domain-containing protein n=1 Tax=Sulfurisphaera javensis TaxID=2049879 RepID=A0AAT9GV45_9CREN